MLQPCFWTVDHDRPHLNLCIETEDGQQPSPREAENRSGYLPSGKAAAEASSSVAQRLSTVSPITSGP